MNELIKIEESNGKRAVSARELHCFLGSRQDFSTWIKNRIEKYQFAENVDYQAFHKIVECQNGVGSSMRTEYALSVDMAKELCMIENNEQGRRARKYFIACEKELSEKARTPQNYLEALKALVASEESKLRLEAQNKELLKENERHVVKIEEDKPKVLFYDSVTSSKTVCLVKELATILNQNGCKNIGQNRLFAWLREKGYLGTKGEYYNMPTQKSMDLNLFKVTKGTRVNPKDGSVTITRTTKVTAKGLAYFVNKFLGNKHD